MKKNMIVLTYVVFFSISPVMAGGLFVTPGSRANSLGSAYVGIADDVTAIYWNPAGLAQLDGSGVRIYSLYGMPKNKSNSSLKNVAIPDENDGDFPLPNIYALSNILDPASQLPANAEPGEFDNKELEIETLLPFAGGYTKVKDITFALGVYTTGGGGGGWEDSVPGVLNPADTVSASMNAVFGFIVTNISAAKSITPELSVGAGINWINMIDRKKIEKEFQSAVLPGYSMEIESNASGSGLEIVGGALYEPVNKMRLGLVVRSGAKICLNGNLTQENGGLAVALGEHETDYKQNYLYPMTCGFGVSYDPVDNLTLAAGVEVNNYSTLKTDIDYEDETALITDVDKNDGWKNTTQLRFGTEYRFDKLALRCGVQNDPVPFSRDKLTLLNINQYNLVLFNIGAGYGAGAFQIDFNYTRAFSDKPGKDDRRYEYLAGTCQLGVGYKF